MSWYPLYNLRHTQRFWKTNFLLLLSSIFNFYRRPSSTTPFKTIANKTVTVDSLFLMSNSMKRFTTFGQFRACHSYETFLGKYLQNLCFHWKMTVQHFVFFFLLLDQTVIVSNLFLFSYISKWPTNK